MEIGEIIWSVFVTLSFLFMVTVGTNWLGPFLKDYRFSEHGIDFVILGGRIRVSHVKRQDIKDVLITSGFGVRLRYPFAHNVTNRLKKRVLFVLTTRGKSYMLTPADPYAAMSALGFDANSQRDLPPMTTRRKLVIAAIGVGVFAVFCMVVVQFVYLAMTWPTNDRDNHSPARQQEMLKITLKVADVAPIPKTAKIKTIETEGNMSTRTFNVEFSADARTIEKWLNESKGIKTAEIEKTGGNVKYIVEPQQGYNRAEVVVDRSTRTVRIRVEWS